MIELTTERLVLRRWTLDDVDFVFDMYSRWEVQRFLGRQPRVMADRVEAVERVQRYATFQHPIHGLWAIADRATRAPFGTLLLKPIPASGPDPLQPSNDVEIGWHLHPDAWGKGYASEAGARVLAHAFAAGLRRVVAVTNAGNTASQKVARAIGMTHGGPTDAYYNVTCELFVATP